MNDSCIKVMNKDVENFLYILIQQVTLQFTCIYIIFNKTYIISIIQIEHSYRINCSI